MVGVAAERGDLPTVVRRVLRDRAAAAELREVLVGDAGIAQGRRERVAGEPRVPARAGVAAHVGDQLDAGAAQQRDELVERVGRVLDGQQLRQRAERAGFEPAMELAAPYSLSRRVP